MRDWLIAFVLTQVIEMPIYVRGLRVGWAEAFAASAITHPVVWFVFFSPVVGFDVVGYWPRVAAAETWAWLAEAAWFGLVLRRRDALLWSAVANAASAGTGLLLRALLGWP